MTETHTTKRIGRCHCGAVQWEVQGNPLIGPFFCHCSGCRFDAGAPFQHLVLYPQAQIKWISGKDNLISWKGMVDELNKTRAERNSCKTCGSKVANNAAAGLTSFAVACFANGESIGKKTDNYLYDEFWKPKFHINYSHRVLDFKDGLPKYATGPVPYGDGKLINE